MPTVVELPLPRPPSEPFFSQRTVLDGREFYFEFNWNGRANRWFLTICDANESPILSGVKLVPGLSSTYRVRDPRFVGGNLFLLGQPPTLDTMGDGSCSLVYVSP